MSNELRKATMAEAKAAWDAFEGKPSIRKVVDAMAEKGLKASTANLQRWKKADWITSNLQKISQAKRQEQKSKPKTVKPVKRVQSPKQSTAPLNAKKADEASEQVSSATEELESKLTRLEIIEYEEAEMKAERERLLADDMSDSELARTAMRESLVAQIVLARQITRRAAIIAEIAPGIAAKLIEKLKAPAASTTIILNPKDEQGQNGDDAKVVDGRVLPQKSESQMAIEAFKARRNHEVAA
jgi:hypothetical protein